MNIIQKIDEPTDWTSSLVVVHKPNGSLRICIDPHELNPCLKKELHPVPTIDELLPDLAKAKIFTKCDVKHGFWHVRLDEETARLTTFATPFGRFMWKRMPFGIAPASQIFQKRLEQALSGLEGVRNIHDDIIVWVDGETTEEAIDSHDRRLQQLLERCEQRGLVLNHDEKKFIFRHEQLPYMGHVFTTKGLQIDPTKVKAIEAMPQPDGPQAIRRFLGMANHVSRFIPNMSELCAPLRSLTELESEWIWNETHSTAFKAVKNAITTATRLKFFDPKLLTTVQCDASSQGLGAVIMQNGQPIAFASRALTQTEKNYCQIEKELQAVVFSMHRFDQYVYGQHVDIETDHQPLEILARKPLKDVPRRLQRMLLELQRYDFTLHYKKGKLLFIADTLSRAHLTEENEEYDVEERICCFSTQRDYEDINLAMETSGLSDERIRQIQENTKCDDVMQDLIRHIKQGWPSNVRAVAVNIRPYFHIRDELVTEDGVIYRGERCVVPSSMRKDILLKLHSAHMGIVGTLRRARESVYWPGMNEDIKTYISKCRICNELRATSQQKQPLMPHDRPDRPWAKVGVDLFQLVNRDFLITVDYWSNYFEIDELSNTNALQVIKCLRRHFATHGIPDVVITDNGPQFSSDAFANFSADWMFKHTTTSPYWPKANGMVESAVKVAKNLIQTALASGQDPWLSILAFRNTPTPDMSTSPVQRLMSRRTKHCCH